MSNIIYVMEIEDTLRISYIVRVTGATTAMRVICI